MTKQKEDEKKSEELVLKLMSSCCKAGVIVDGIGDFKDNERIVTRHYACVKCGNPCDVIAKETYKIIDDDLKCRNCGKIIPDLGASYEDDFCSEECFKEYDFRKEEYDEDYKLTVD